MSKISTLYDLFHTRITTVLPDHLRLSDPYQFLKNTDSEKRQGYGVTIGPGEHTGNNLSCDIILRQELNLVLTRISQGRETDAAKKAEAEKQLMEDLFLVVSDIEKNGELGDPVTVLSSAYVSHGGITFVSTERDDILKIEAVFRFRYRQDLN